MKRHLIKGLLIAGALCSVTSTTYAASLNAKTYWVGNTWGGANEQWHPASIADIYVRPDGKIFTNSYWDEGGKEALVFNTNGIEIAQLELTHGRGGFAVTADATYVYMASRENKGSGRANRSLIHAVRRYKHDGTRINWNKNKAPLVVNDLTTRNAELNLSGLAVFGNNLYVSNPRTKKIHVYNKTNQAVIRSFALTPSGSIPYKLDVDKSGFLWAVQKLPNGTYRVRKYDSKGVYQNKQITTIVEPTDIAIGHKTGYLFITDNGPEQCGFVYDVSGAPKFIRHIGVRKGVFAGTRPGATAGNKMFGPSGIGEDSQGKVYTASTGVGNPLQAEISGKIFNKKLLNDVGLGATLKRFNPDGKVASYTRNGLEFLDMADARPSNPRIVYTKDSRHTIDYSKTPGTGWKHAAWTIDPFKYPHDPRIALRRSATAGTRIVRVKKGGIVGTFQVIQSQADPYLFIYRFKGNIAIPAFVYSRLGTDNKNHQNTAWPPNAPASIGDKSWLWNDLDGDGQMDANEYSTFDRLHGRGWPIHVDEAGTLWIGEEGNKEIHRLTVEKIAKGVPIYNTIETIDLDDLIGGVAQLERFYYDNKTDRAFIGCYTTNDPNPDRTWGHVGTRLKRLDHWSRAFDDNPSTKPKQIWEKDIQHNVNSKFRAMTVEKDYIFLGSSQTKERAGRIEVRKVSDGAKVGDLKPGSDVGGRSGRIDANRAVNAHRKSDGTYVVFVEENLRGKVIYYQWKP